MTWGGWLPLSEPQFLHPDLRVCLWTPHDRAFLWVRTGVCTGAAWLSCRSSAPVRDWAVRRPGVQESPVHPGLEATMSLQVKGIRFFSTQPLVDNVVQHKRPIVEQEVVFWRVRGPGLKFGSGWCFGRTCRPLFSV